LEDEEEKLDLLEFSQNELVMTASESDILSTSNTTDSNGPRVNSAASSNATETQEERQEDVEMEEKEAYTSRTASDLWCPACYNPGSRIIESIQFRQGFVGTLFRRRFVGTLFQ
jgi:hypothetical protein